MLHKSVFEIHGPGYRLAPRWRPLEEGAQPGQVRDLAGSTGGEQASSPQCLFFPHGACCELKFPLFRMFHTNVSNVSYGCCKRYEMSRMLHMCITCIASVLPECCKPPPLEDEIQLEADRLRSQEACFPHVARNVPCFRCL
jgi:hypothetical protein